MRILYVALLFLCSSVQAEQFHLFVQKNADSYRYLYDESGEAVFIKIYLDGENGESVPIQMEMRYGKDLYLANVYTDERGKFILVPFVNSAHVLWECKGCGLKYPATESKCLNVRCQFYNRS